MDKKKEICKFLKNVVGKLDDKMVKINVLRPLLENIIFEVLDQTTKSDFKSVLACCELVSTFIAINDDEFSAAYIKDRNLLTLIERVLSKGNNEMKLESLSILKNVSCGSQSCNLIINT